jgi:hypothetical protein
LYNSTVNVNNTLISNCGKAIIAEAGGNYQFINCTFAGYSNNYITHKSALVQLTDKDPQAAGSTTNPLTTTLQNCIIWGEANGFVKNETIFNKVGNNFAVTFTNNLYRAEVAPANANITASIQNQNPLFDSIDVQKNFYNYRISNPNAPGVNKGSATSFNKDVADKPRSVGLPDIGCYEQQ